MQHLPIIMSVFVSTMETRVTKLEAEIAILKRQVSVLRRTKHTKHSIKDCPEDVDKNDDEMCTIT